jgi:hypothetical protein
MHLALNPTIQWNGKSLFWVAVSVFSIALIYALFQEINTDDETWFLQVVRRVLSGEVLYRDIYFGLTPLSAYVTAFFCLLFGVELLVARAVLALYFTLGVILVLLILKELKLERYVTPLLIGSLLVLVHPQSNWGFSPYNPLAKVLFLAVFWMALKWGVSFQRKWLIGASICAALCLGTKQNVGAIAESCLFACICWARRSAFVKDFFLQMAISLLVLCLLFSPTILQGGGSFFLDYTIWNKPRYLALTHHTYFLDFPNFDPYSLFIYMAPFLLFFGGIYALRCEEEYPLQRSALFVFLIGAVAVLYPKPDHTQKIAYVPFVLIALLYCYSKLEQKARTRHPVKKATEIFFLACFSLQIGFSLAQPIWQWQQGKTRRSSVSHFRGIVMDRFCYRHWQRMKREFQAAGEPTFFLSTHAGFYYLLFNLSNPTPFDIPIHPALGCEGEKQLILNFQDQELRLIRDHPCWSNWFQMNSTRRPYELEAFIESQMVQKTDSTPGFDTIFQIFEKR